jgi:hypothetical protein
MAQAVVQAVVQVILEVLHLVQVLLGKEMRVVAFQEITKTHIAVLVVVALVLLAEVR